MKFSTHSMQSILPIIEETLKNNSFVSFDVLDPDLGEGFYAGHQICIDGTAYIYRGYKTWVDLAELYMCTMLTPQKSIYPFVTITFKKLKTRNSFHLGSKDNKKEKYGVDSHFSQIHKMEEPAFLYYYEQALYNVSIEKRKRVLDLGINRGDEFEVIKNSLDINTYDSMQFIGIDHSQSAIEYAKSIFREKNVIFYTEDINNIDTLKLGCFDLLISIGTLQSPSINFKPFFMSLVQNYLNKDAAIILGFPNSRWVGGEMIYGAKAPNYAMSEQSLLYNDIIFCKKYLQQKKFRVTITGKQYVFLTATKII